MAIRVIVDAAGALLLLAPGWQMQMNWLLGFVAVFYGVLLVAESTVAAWVVRRSR